MNYTLDDRHRSLRQYVALGMDGIELYDLQLQRVHIADDKRPAGLIEPSTSVVALTPPRTSFERGPVPVGVNEQQTFAVILYPRLDGDDVRDVSLRAREHTQRLTDVFAIGLVHDDGSSLSPPEMVPVWDHAQATATGADRANVPEQPYGWMKVEDRSIRPLQDPLDDRRWSIIGSLRLSWWRAGRDSLDPPLRTLPGTWAGDGPGSAQIAGGGGIPSGERWGVPTVTRS